jgi:hypothetical protein
MYENGKIRPVETILRMGGEEIRENDGGGNLRFIISTFVNATMHPQYNNNMTIKNKNTF